ncbi:MULTISPECIES: SDR family oxidoreductase [Corynebacterium]|nr:MULTISPECIES: NAD(P)-dependent oxidoreductase [Corynebacterium]MDN8623988.1 NAD(P)-dependent oxidoreductase [Corynebacterium kroppenstedtii]QRQ64217.1 sugar nucleotide-binding protein [Corynebacterium kroppenstedtii]
MNILIAGGRGQLGTALAMTAPAPVCRGRISCLGRTELDITKQDVIYDVLGSEQPDMIINAAAYTAVDRAEDPAHQDVAQAVNTDGAAYMAQAAAQAGIPFVHISTDYVYGQNDPIDREGNDQADSQTETSEPFIGGHTPLRVDAPTHPQSVYGRTKLAGDRAVQAAFENTDVPCVIVRTAWVYSGSALPNHHDFVSTMMRLEQQSRNDASPHVRVVNDQWGSPTNVFDLARGLWELSGASSATINFPAILAPGSIVHCTGAGACTWWDVARRVFAGVGADPDRVIPISTQDYPTAAARPQWSVLDNSSWLALGLTPLPAWEDGVDRAVSGAC